MDMHIPVQVTLYDDHSYGQQLMQVPYEKTCTSTFGDMEFPVYDNSGDRNYSNNSIIIGYSDNSHGNSNISNSGYEYGLDMGDNCDNYEGITQSSGLQSDKARHEPQVNKLDPYSPLCMVPLPDHLIQPGFIRRRNERERERVRCVNEGYDKLKEHLPIENKDRRISKVETLRRAIDYIRELQNLLAEADEKCRFLRNGCSEDTKLISKRRKTRSSHTDNDVLS